MSRRASADDHALQRPDEEMMLRRLADGREYQIVKQWFQADALQRQLVQLGWVGRVVAASFAAGTPVTAYNLGVRGETSVQVASRW